MDRRTVLRVLTGIMMTPLAASCASAPAVPALNPGSAAPTTAPAAARPKTKLVVTQALAAGSISAAPYYIGQSLGFWDQEGIEPDVQSLQGGASKGITMVESGQAETVSILPDGILVPTAAGQDLGLVWIYGVYQRPTHQLAVLASSDITDVHQLRGKTVGISALGPPAQTFFETWLRRAGMDPSEVTEIAVGNSIPAAEALRSGQVQALVQSGGDLTTFETAGYQFRWFPHPPELDALFGAGFVISRDLSSDRRDAMARYLRAFTKSVIFIQQNPSAAVRLMWDLFPSSKPKDVPEATALSNGAKIVKSLNDPAAKASNGQWGYISPERWKGYVSYLGLDAKIQDVGKLTDYSLLATINQFDEAQAQQFAQGYKG